MKWTRTLLGVVLLVIIPLLSGCWDRLEIEDRGTILGLAIDPVEHVSPDITGPYAKSNVTGYKLTAQVAIPGRIPLGPGGGTSPGETEKPVWVVSATGKTVDAAINNLQQQLADRLFLGHLRVIIVNRQLAESPGLYDIQDFFRRNAEIRRLAWLIISEKDADISMEAAPKLERVPTLYLVGTMDHAVELGKLPNIFLGNYWSVLSAKGQEPVLPLISVKGQDRIQIDGLAVFKGSRMVGAMDPLETAAFLELTNVRRAGYAVAVPAPGDPNRSVMVKGYNRKTRYKLRKVDHRLKMDVYTRIESAIEESTDTRPVSSSLPTVKTEFRNILIANQLKLIRRMQSLGTDVFGFGEYVRGQYPQYWLNHIQTRERWDDAFRHLPVDCHMKLYVRRYGMAAR